MPAPTPKSDQLRALREAKFAHKPAKAAPEKMAIARKALKSESNALSNKQSNTPSFDKRAYQRDYMRKLHAEKANG